MYGCPNFNHSLIIQFVIVPCIAEGVHTFFSERVHVIVPSGDCMVLILFEQLACVVAHSKASNDPPGLRNRKRLT